MRRKKARRIRIKIVADGRKIWIPGIPFWLLRVCCRIAKKIAERSNKDTAVIRELDIDGIIDVLADTGPLILADVEVKEDNTKVYIEIR